MTDKDVKNYLADISRYLVCTNRQKKIILEDIEISVWDYIENANVNDISVVYKHFGSPEVIAKTYLADLANPADVKKALGKKKLLIVAVVTALVVALLIWGIGVIITLIDHHNEDPGYIVEGSAIEVEEGVDIHDQNYEVIL